MDIWHHLLGIGRHPGHTNTGEPSRVYGTGLRENSNPGYPYKARMLYIEWFGMKLDRPKFFITQMGLVSVKVKK